MNKKNMLDYLRPAWKWTAKQIVAGVLFAVGGALTLWIMYAFQAMTTDPNATGFQSSGVPMLTRSGSSFDRQSMSMQTVSDSINSITANEGMYNNRIQLATYPNAYDEVCFKNGGTSRDVHTAGESTSWGTCVPWDVGYVIERNETGPSTWTAAKAMCLSRGMRLPEVFEWELSCKCATNDAAYPGCGWVSTWSEMSNMTNNWETASNSARPMYDGPTSGVAVLVLGNGGCTFALWGWVGNSANSFEHSSMFRCAR